MLYEFHALQNEKHPGTVHATYMIYGVKRTAQVNGHSSNNDDVEMTSSPPVAPEPAEEVPQTTLSLVTEENISGMAQLFRIPVSGQSADILQMCFRNMRALRPSISTAWVHLQSRYSLYCGNCCDLHVLT